MQWWLGLFPLHLHCSVNTEVMQNTIALEPLARRVEEFDKGNWTEENTQILCDLVVEQIREGNYLHGHMKNTAYKVMAQKYYECTNLFHAPKQLENRYNQCEAMYQWINWADGEPGLCRGDNGSIIADDGWWENYTQGKYSECKKFKYGMPSYIDQLAEMFGVTTVDVWTSYVAGESEEPTYGNLDMGEEEDEVDIRSPLSSSSKKRTGSNTDTASSPPRKHKSPMIECEALIDTLQSLNSKDLDVAKQIQEDHIAKNKKLEQEKENKEIDKCFELAKECGATEETEEFYVATRIFAERYYRYVFIKMTTDAGRMAWLKKWCRDWTG